MDSESPARWVIGDLHGCLDPLERLLALLEPDAKLWFVGDLINRGPASLETLRRVVGLGDRAEVVLGNHDLFLLACAAGLRAPRRSDTLSEILQAPDADALVHWLRHRPLLVEDGDDVMVHAGWHPRWDRAAARAAARRIEAALRSPGWREALAEMWGCRGVPWDAEAGGKRRLGDDLAALTRIRTVAEDGALGRHKGAPEKAPEGERAWWSAESPRQTRLFVGHWAAQGARVLPGVIATDSGCVWGGRLSAVRRSDLAWASVPA